MVRAGVLLLAVAWWLAAGIPPPAALALTILVLASAEAVFEPALAATLPVLLPDRQLLPAANALFDTTERSARLVGPGLVALLAASVPVMHFFTLDAASFLLSALAVLALGPVRVPASRATASLRAGVAHGFAALRQHRLLWTILWCKTGTGSFWYVAYLFALPLAIEQAHIAGPGGTGLGAYGLVISAYGCTNVLSTLVVGSRALPAHPGRLVLIGSMLSGAGTAGLAMGALMGLPVLIAAAALGAVGGPMGDIPAAVLRQTELAPGDVAAATRAFMVVRFGATLLGMLAAPATARWAGASALLLICGALPFAVGGVALAKHWNDAKGLGAPCGDPI